MWHRWLGIAGGVRETGPKRNHVSFPSVILVVRHGMDRSFRSAVVHNPVVGNHVAPVVMRNRRRQSDEAQVKPLSCKLVGGRCGDSG